MTEILFIIIQIISILLLFTYSSYGLLFPTLSTNENLYQKISANLIINLNILLIISFFKIPTTLGFLFLFSLTVLNLIFYKKLKNKITFNPLILVLFFLFIFLITINLFDNLYLGWDAKLFYILKTINFHSNLNVNSLNDLPVYDYPHLGSFVWALFWKFPLNISEVYGRIFYIIVYCSSIFLFIQKFKIENTKKIILLILFFLATYKYEYFSGLQEILVFSFILIATKFCLDLIEEKNINVQKKIIYLIIGITNIACWIKNEGLILMLIINFSLLFLQNISFKNKLILIGGSVLVIFIRSYFIISSNIDLISFQFDTTTSKINLFDLFKDIKIIVFYSFVYFTQLPIYLIGIPFIFWLIFKKNFRIDTKKFLIVHLVLSTLFIIVAFLLTHQNIEWQTRVGLKRVLFENSSFYLISIYLLFNKIKKTKFKNS